MLAQNEHNVISKKMWFFDTQKTPGGASIVERNFFESKQPLWYCNAISTWVSTINRFELKYYSPTIADGKTSSWGQSADSKVEFEMMVIQPLEA